MRQSLALTSGDPAGVGLELAAQAWERRADDDIAPFFLITDLDHLADRFVEMGRPCPLEETTPEGASEIFGHALPVVKLSNRYSGSAGQPNVENAAGIVESIDRAVDYAVSGAASAVVTCPISKHVLYDAGFAFPGHTEYLAHLIEKSGSAPLRPVMMLVGPELRTVPVTIHIPLADVSSALTTSAIVETARIAARDLRERFGIAWPRLAIAGLNPHAGEGGALGHEDDTIVRPAVQMLAAEGIEAKGPYPADTMFHKTARETYDAAICMYHDQALIPAKTLAFDEAVNVTLGLPIIRTSPDHGTAFDIAGHATARPDSLIAALKLAAEMVQRAGK